MFLVGLPKETRIVETGSQHAFVSVPDNAVGIAVGIQDRQKMREQLAAGVLDREIFLVIAHHRDQDFLRQLQKFGIETSQNCRWPLGQVDHGIKQQLVFTPARTGNGAGGGV